MKEKKEKVKIEAIIEGSKTEPENVKFELAFKQPNQPLDRQLDILQNLGKEISQRQEGVSLTLNNLPTAYIDPQAVLEEITTPTIEAENNSQSKALIQIDYLDGMPIVNGLPFWERLDCEPLNYYRLFKTYRDMKIEEPNRSFKKLEKDTNTSINYLYALSKIYHWQYRTLAFDIYQLQKIEKERNRQIEIMEGNHKKAAERIFEICTTYLEVIEETGLIAAASPKEIQGWADLAIKLERLSLGLPGDKPKEVRDNNDKGNKVVNITKIENQQNQIQNVATQNNNPIKGLNDVEHRKYLQEVANTLMIASPEVINNKNGTEQSKTINSEPDVEARIDEFDTAIDAKNE